MYWIFRTKFIDAKFGENELAFSWLSMGRPFYAEEGDRVLILDRIGGENFFTYLYSILSVENTQLENDRYDITVTLNLNQAF